MKTMRIMRSSITVAVVLSVAAVSIRAEMFAVKLKLTGYAGGGTTLGRVPLSSAALASSCISTTGTQLAAIVDDATSNITALVTVDTCGNVLCTDLTVTASCSQMGVSSTAKALTGRSVAHIQYASPTAAITGDGFLLEQGTANPTNSADVTAYTATGTMNLCNARGQVIAGTISIKGPIKVGKNCP